MNKYEIVKRIEEFAPLETQEKWDCSGWLVETAKQEVSKILYALTVTKDVNCRLYDFRDMMLLKNADYCAKILI